MSDVVNRIASETGISAEQIQKGLGAFFSFLKKELGTETYTEVEANVPDAAHAVKTFEAAPEASEGPGNLLGMVTDLAGKFLGGKSGAGAELVANFAKLGFKPEQIESFLSKVFELIRTHLPPDLVQKILASLPALASMFGGAAKKEA